MTGFVNVDKEEGRSSAYVVNRIKWLLHESCGHMGTLDPLASGVLPVGVGNATRLFDYFLSKEKTYLAHFRFGVTTDTLDRESELRFGGSVPSCSEIERALESFRGEIMQTPPKYSAVSVGGRRGYELAREGSDFEIKAKPVKISSFRLLEQIAADEFSFEIVCGGGTYIRSLARDLAAALGTFGFMSYLRRTRSGLFCAEEAVKLDALTRENVSQYLIPTDCVLPFERLDCSDEKLYHGLPVACDRQDGLYSLYNAEGFYGLARVTNGFLKTEKKLC